MSDKGSVFQKGGGGTNFEQYVQSAFLTTLIVRGNIPCFTSAQITEIAFQSTNWGYQTDDLLVIAKSDLREHRLLAQIKHNLTFSDSTSNSIFKDVMTAFWADFNNTKIFNKENDRLIIIKSGLTLSERNHIRSLLNWAKTHNNEIDFFTEACRIEAKKEYITLFQSVLKKANNGKDLLVKELWQFLKCLDILEYDFLNEGSVDESNFINLIKLSKNCTTSTGEKEIWDSIYALAAKYNKDGGSVSFEGICADEIFKHFDILKLNPLSKSIQKLKSDSRLILNPLINTIGGLHIGRTDLQSLILNSINANQLTIITGNPGVGKSVIVKDLFEKDFSESSVFVFRADQFNEPHLANVFSKIGIHESIEDIISCLSLLPEKIIMIDSLEKLLEGDPESAFKQLLYLLSVYPDIKIVTTSRKYAVDLIIHKFGIENILYNKIEIPELTEEEQAILSKAFPQLLPLLINPKIKLLLRSPKYLDFSIKSLRIDSEDLSSISLSDFKRKFWNDIIEDSTTRQKGLARKRNNAFLNIAIKRAKKMQLFVEPDDNQEEAIDALVKDEVIIQQEGDYKFSPSHDILEDWALIRYIESKYEDSSIPKKLFESLGNEPAIRRAFRLWIEDNLIEDYQKISDLISSTLSNNSIEKYWSDEVIVAIFKSADCATFFHTLQVKLLEDNGELLNRCLHILRTACKESISTTILIPQGSGWREMLVFLKLHINRLDKYRLSIANFLLDWEYRLLFLSTIDEFEIDSAKSLTIYYLDQIESEDAFWLNETNLEKGKELISLLYNLANISKTEISNLTERAFSVQHDKINWRLGSFYENVIEKLLSGIYSRKIVKELPELIVKTAWREWKLKIPEKSIGADESYFYHRNGVLDTEDCWGIEDKRSFFPSGVYNTPIYNLLFHHPFIGLKFITEFINYSIEFYVNAKCNYKHEIVEIEINLNDGTTKKEWGSWELWAAYRGISVTHYALESILMSLEKYLLEIAAIKTEISRKNIQFIFGYLLQNSNNITICGLLTSVAIAYPEEVGNELLPLLSVKEFYQWDLNRSLQEHSALAPMDMKISFAQKERHRLNQLPHRKKFTRGLTDFIVDYQFNIRTLNKDILKVFDNLKVKYPNEDVIWKKTLTEIDIRNQQIGEYDAKLGGFPIVPKYDKEITEFINSGQEEFDLQNTSLSFTSKIWKAYDKKEEMSYDYWSICYNHYLVETNRNNLFDRPVSLAVLGLRDFYAQITSIQKDWCIKTIIDTNAIILQDTFTRNYGLNFSYNLLEKEISLKSLHLVFPELKSEEEKSIIIGMIINYLIAPFAEHEIDRIIEYFKNTFFIKFPEDAKRIWIGLIKYAEFKKNNPRKPDYLDERSNESFSKKVKDFIDYLSLTKDLTLEISSVNINSYEINTLLRALVVTPYILDDSIFNSFIVNMIPFITMDLKNEEDFSYNRKKGSRQIHFQTRHDIEEFLAELLITAKFDLSQNVLDLLLDPVYKDESIAVWRGRDDLFEFDSNILETVIFKLDNFIANQTYEDQHKIFIENFWIVWEYFFEKAKQSKKQYFVKTLFLDIKWKTESFQWKALDKKQDFYKGMILSLGKNKSQSILNVFSTVGEKTFLPEGITWLTTLLKNNPTEMINLISPAGERLIKRLFHNHIVKIKTSKVLMDDYLWILNNMIDLGSSEAYLFRENVITYKSNC